MTIIAAAEDKHGYWIGSDSMGNAAGTMVELGSKLINKKNYIIGFSESYRLRDIIEEDTKLPVDIKTMRSLRSFRDRIIPVTKEEEITFGLIIISSGGIFDIDSDYQIHKINNYIAIGSGSDFALGALRAILRTSESAAIAVREAVEAAIFHSSTCGGNVHIEHIEKP